MDVNVDATVVLPAGVCVRACTHPCTCSCCSRNLVNFPMVASMTKVDRIHMERVIGSVIKRLTKDPEFGGSYWWAHLLCHARPCHAIPWLLLP